MIEFTRINNDTNGNPRYVCHFLAFIKNNDQGNSGYQAIEASYKLALKRSRQFGGRKFHNKQYGGGIVFRSYNPDDLGEKIESFVKSL